MLDFGGPAMVKCAKVKQLPTIAFKIGGREFMLAPEQYILKIDAGQSRCLTSILNLNIESLHVLVLRSPLESTNASW